MEIREGSSRPVDLALYLKQPPQEQRQLRVLSGYLSRQAMQTNIEFPSSRTILQGLEFVQEGH